MKRLFVVGSLMAAVQILGNHGAIAGPLEDGVAAYNRGDYIPAIHLFRPLAQTGNAKAQRLLGAMYRRGQGVTKNPARAFMWFSIASARGDAAAKTELHEMSSSMTAEELSQAREMMQACEASDYRNCAY